VDEESLDSGHTPGLDERGWENRLERDVSSMEPRIRPVLVNWGGKVRKKAPWLGDGGASYEGMPRLGASDLQHLTKSRLWEQTTHVPGGGLKGESRDRLLESRIVLV
jgi:hypothetical protein